MPTFVGLDVHLRTCHATMMNEQREILRQEKFPNKQRELGIFKCIDDAKATMEVCYCWQPVYELLESMGYEVKLAHPMKTCIIVEARIKTDAVNTEALARLLSTNLLPTSYVPPKELRELRELIRLRTTWCKNRQCLRTRFGWSLQSEGSDSRRIPSPNEEPRS